MLTSLIYSLLNVATCHVLFFVVGAAYSAALNAKMVSYQSRFVFEAATGSIHLLSVDGGDRVVLRRFRSDIPTYAIFSHTWGKEHDEVNFQDLKQARSEYLRKQGYAKVQFCMKQARKDGIKYCWVDTCCIDRRSLAELQGSICSMYRWYAEAEICYVYLSDVHVESDFSRSRWFRRGWTLQELLAPKQVVFFSARGVRLGTKKDLAKRIQKITGVPEAALLGENLSQFSRQERMKWMEDRETEWEEDMAYAQLGILGIDMYIWYGEGKRAIERLKREVRKRDVEDRLNGRTWISSSSEATASNSDLRYSSINQESDPETHLRRAIEACRDGDDAAYKTCLTSLTMILIASNARVDLEAVTIELKAGNPARVQEFRSLFTKLREEVDIKARTTGNHDQLIESRLPWERTGGSVQTRSSLSSPQILAPRQSLPVCPVEGATPLRLRGSIDYYSPEDDVRYGSARTRANTQVLSETRTKRLDPPEIITQIPRRTQTGFDDSWAYDGSNTMSQEDGRSLSANNIREKDYQLALRPRFLASPPPRPRLDYVTRAEERVVPRAEKIDSGSENRRQRNR